MVSKHVVISEGNNSYMYLVSWTDKNIKSYFSSLCSEIVWVMVVLKRTVVGY